jgi:hypothetical protein
MRWRKRRPPPAAEVKESCFLSRPLDVDEEGTPADQIRTPALDRSTPDDPTLWTWEERLTHTPWQEQRAAIHAANRAALGLEPDDGNADLSGQREYGVAPRVEGNPRGPRLIQV